MDAALVVLSGGQDSTTCLYWALDRFGAGHVAAVTFDYGQRHRIELDCAARVAARAAVPHTVLPINTFAAALAYQREIHHLVAGVAQTDYSGYPDCRQATLQALEQALRLGMDYEITLHTPLMFRSKADTVRLARDLGALPALADTHTCYHGQQPPCGECPACVLRARGFAEAGIPDPLVERFREMTL